MGILDLERLAHRFDELALRPQSRGIPTFQCPVCNAKFQNDATGIEPACTGPSQTRDDHPMTPMVRIADERPSNVIHFPV